MKKRIIEARIPIEEIKKRFKTVGDLQKFYKQYGVKPIKLKGGK